MTDSSSNTSHEHSLLLLGTAAGDANFGLPSAAGRAAKDVRRYSSQVLSPDILIDFNHQTAAALETFGVEANSIRHLLISHGHFDHLQPVEILNFAADLPQPLPIYGNTMACDALTFCRDNWWDPEIKRWVAKQSTFNVELHVLKPGMSAQVGASKVTAVHGNHFMNVPYRIMEQQSLNFVIEIGGTTIFYGLDSSYLLPETARILADFRFDLAVLDATFGPLEIDPVRSGHLNWKMLDETIAELRATGSFDDDTVIVASHISTANVEAYADVRDQLTAKGITLAYDGLRLGLRP